MKNFLLEKILLYGIIMQVKKTQGRPWGGGVEQLGHFSPGPSLKGAPGGPLEYLFKRSIYSNRAVRSRYSNRAVTVFFRGAV